MTLLLATKTKKYLRLFIAIMSAFTISVALAVLFGAALRLLVPPLLLHIFSGSIFILMGILLIRDGKIKKEKLKKAQLRHPFLTAMVLTFFADFGDKTQIALTLFATTNNLFLVFLAGILALGLDTCLMIIFSHFILKKVHTRVIELLAGIVFIGVGIFLLF